MSALRRTPLRPGQAELRRENPLRRSTPLVARKHVMSPEERVGKELVRARSGGRCEIAIPGVCTGRGLDWHHRKRRSQGGDWSAANGLLACRVCHDWIGDEPEQARAEGWLLRSREIPEDVPARLFCGQFFRLTVTGGHAPYLGQEVHGDAARTS